MFSTGAPPCFPISFLTDLDQLATHADMIAEMAYRALGDFSANDGHKADLTAWAQLQAPPRQIILPEAIALLREQRAALAAQQCPAQGNGEPPCLNN